jgi:hypothetical protein
MNQPIALQAEQMRAHRVVGELQGRREIVHGLFPRPQQLEDLSPRACEDAFAPTGMFHCPQHTWPRE